MASKPTSGLHRRALSAPPPRPRANLCITKSRPIPGLPSPHPLTGLERSRYLELPLLDIRIYSLARRWSGDGARTRPRFSFEDRAASAERFQVRARRAGTAGAGDPLADFLFVRKQGSCTADNFASAMAVMLRAQGIPSRVATGFQSGYFNDACGLSVVRASDAHAWVEAWIGDPSGNSGPRRTLDHLRSHARCPCPQPHRPFFANQHVSRRRRSRLAGMGGFL